MSGIQIQVHLTEVVHHHGEPCTYRWTKNIIFGNKKKMAWCPRFWTLLDNYKILSERMNVLTIYLPRGKLPVASNLRIVKTAVHVVLLYDLFLVYIIYALLYTCTNTTF